MCTHQYVWARRALYLLGFDEYEWWLEHVEMDIGGSVHASLIHATTSGVYGGDVGD